MFSGVGGVCSQGGTAGTKAERGHSCPQQRRTEVKLSNVPILLSIRELLRTRMSALRWRPQNLRALRRFFAGGRIRTLPLAPSPSDSPRCSAVVPGGEGERG